MPFEPLVNYIFRNNGDFTFSKYNEEWGITERGYSNGVAYADLDNDGDLELIVNNIDGEALIYKNNAVENKSGNYLKVEFEGTTQIKWELVQLLLSGHDGRNADGRTHFIKGL